MTTRAAKPRPKQPKLAPEVWFLMTGDAQWAQLMDLIDRAEKAESRLEVVEMSQHGLQEIVNMAQADQEQAERERDAARAQVGRLGILLMKCVEWREGVNLFGGDQLDDGSRARWSYLSEEISAALADIKEGGA